jgi:hypothetical protein
MVVEGQPTTNYDTSTLMYAGYDYDECHEYPTPGIGDRIIRSLVKFDTSSIAQGAPIPQAELYLFMPYLCDRKGRHSTVTVHRATSLWSSETVDWTTQPTLGEAISLQTFPPIETKPWGWYAFDITELVKGWANGDYLNLGLAIRGPEGEADGARFGFVTSEYMDGAYAPRIIFTHDTQANAAESSVHAPFTEIDCLPEALLPFEVQGDSYQLMGARVCPAE